MANNIIGSTAVLVLAFGLVGCGSSSSRGGFSNEAGASGSSPTEETGGRNGNSGGGSAAGETGGTTGETGGQGTTGGNLGQAGSGTETGGSSTGGSGPCVPKSCLSLAIELSGYDVTSGDPVPESCGVLEDGCGNYISCGNCTTPGTACGRGAATGVMVAINPDAPSLGYTSEEEPGFAGVCGGGCGGFQNASLVGPNSAALCTLSNGASGFFSACTLSPDDPNATQPEFRADLNYVCEIQYSEWARSNNWCCGRVY